MESNLKCETSMCLCSSCTSKWSSDNSVDAEFHRFKKLMEYMQIKTLENEAARRSPPNSLLAIMNVIPEQQHGELTCFTGLTSTLLNQSFPVANHSLYGNGFVDNQIKSPNLILNELLHLDTNYEGATVPPLSPIVGGETRSSRMLSVYRGTSPPQNEFSFFPSEVEASEIGTTLCFHGDNFVQYYCFTCNVLFCRDCMITHKVHQHFYLKESKDTLKIGLQNQFTEVRSCTTDLGNGIEKVNKEYNDLERNYHMAKERILLFTKNIMEAVEARQNALMTELNQICNYKKKILNEQLLNLKTSKSKLILMERYALDHTETIAEINLIKARIKINNCFQKIDPVKLTPFEESTLHYGCDNGKVYNVLENYGQFHSMGCARTTDVFGTCLRNILVNEKSHFTIYCNDHLGRKRKTGGDELLAYLTYPDGETISLPLTDYKNGDYDGNFTTRQFGEHIIEITLRGLLVSIDKANAFKRRDPSKIKYSLTTFGNKPEEVECLSRGWGLHCDRNGIVYATDRDRHCIFIYTPDMKLMKKIGKFGEGNGEFNRPAGITIDKDRRLIVVDKDNHRVQIFTLHGQFITKFGRYGKNSGEFNYPWGIDTNSRGDILVADSRNSRIQLFDKAGNFLACTISKFDMGRLNIAEIPRGVAFGKDGNIYWSDFNNHHVNVLSPNLTPLNLNGKFGNIEGQFCRPQGIFIDSNGYIYVAEAKTSSLYIYTPNKKFCNKLCTKGNQFFPCDVTMAPDGSLLLMDLNLKCIRKL